jgi:DnaJ-class molecular chaperone
VSSDAAPPVSGAEPGDQAGENTCPDCSGSGQADGGTCSSCDGRGTVVELVGDA